MSSQFSLPFSIPLGFPGVLKEFTREVLRAINMNKTCGETEEEILAFANTYFADMIGSSATPSLSDNEILDIARKLFIAADADQSGSLDKNEIESVLRELATSLGLSRQADVAKVVSEVMAVADTDANGVIDYYEFLPVAADIVQTVYGNVAQRAQEENRMIQKLVDKIFTAYDDDGSGFLDRMEFHSVFQDLVGELGMNADYARRLSDEVLAATDSNADGKVSRSEFTPLAIDIISAIIDEAENHNYENTQKEDAQSAYIEEAEQILDATNMEAARWDAETRQKAQVLIGSMSAMELNETLQSIFASADTDGNGTLDAEEMRRCLFEADVGLNEEMVEFLTTKFDENEDGVVSYAEFAPLCYDMLVEVVKQEIQNSEIAAAEDEVIEQARMLEAEKELYRGLTPDQLEELVYEVFKSVDHDGNDTLDPSEFVAGLKMSSLQLTDEEVEIFLQELDVDGDGQISYSEFTPVALRILKEITRERMDEQAANEAALDEEAQLAASALLNSMTPQALQETLHGIFIAADEDGSGTLDRNEFKICLAQTNLGLTDDLIEYLMNSVDMNADGLVSYAEFEPLCRELLEAVTAQQLKDEVVAEAEEDLRQQATFAAAEDILVHGMTKTEVDDMLEEVFKELDTDGSGHLEPKEFVDALAVSSLKLSDEETVALMEAIDTDSDGKLTLDEFRPVAFRLLTEVVAETLA